jgi:hypothetical protein
MGDRVTAEKLKILDLMVGDSRVNALDFRLAYWIASRIDRETGWTTVFQQTITTGIGIKSIRGMQQSAKRIKEFGYLEIVSRPGVGNKNSYRLTLPISSAKPAPAFGFQGDEADETCTAIPENPHSHSDKPARPFVEVSPVISPVISPERESARATFISNNFEISDATYNWALGHLGSNDRVDLSVEKFRNHFLQLDGPRAKCRDWDAKARNWILDDARNGPRPDKSVHTAANRLASKLRGFDGGATDREIRQITAFAKGAANRLASDVDVAELPPWAKAVGNGKYFVQIESEGGDLIRRHCKATHQTLPISSQRESAFIVPYVRPPGSDVEKESAA